MAAEDDGRGGGGRFEGRRDGGQEDERTQRRRLREELRRRGVPVPQELLEPEARPVLAGRGGRGEDRARATTNGTKILVRTWQCTCGYWNLPSRPACRLCESRRRFNAPRRDDWWAAEALPPGAAEEAHRLPARGDRPTGEVTRRGTDGTFDPAARRVVPGLPPRRAAAVEARPPPPAAAGRPEPARGGGGEETRTSTSGRPSSGAGVGGGFGAGAGEGDDGGQWELKQKGRRKGRGRKNDEERRDDAADEHADDADGLQGEGVGGDERAAGEAFEGAPKPHELPQLRGWTMPLVHRDAVLRQAKAAAERHEALEARGARPEKVKKAADLRAKYEQDVRVAGGPTPRTLLWQIKEEEDRIAKTRKSIEKAVSDRDEKEERKRRLEDEIGRMHEVIRRLHERCAEATERLRYLTQQKWVENVPEEWVQHFKTLAATLGTNPAQPMVQALVDLMVPPAVDVDLAAQDTESEHSGDEDGEGSSDSTEETKPERDGGQDQEGERQARIRDVEEELEALRADRCEAMARAQAEELRASKRNKRNADGEPVDMHDADGDVDVTPPLTTGQIVEHFRTRIEAKNGELRQLRSEQAGEVVPCTATARGGGGEDERRGHSRRGRSGGPSSGTRHTGTGRTPHRGASCLQEARGAGVAGRRQNPVERWISASPGPTERESDHATRRARPSTPKRAGGAGGAGNGRTGGTAQANTGSNATLKLLVDEVARNMERQRAAAKDLEDRVRDGRQKQEQERMQATQEKEAAQAAAVGMAKGEIESRIIERHEMAEGCLGGAIQGAGAGPPSPNPTFGPTGIRLDEQQACMLQAAGREDEDAVMGDARTARDEIPRVRRTRWEALHNVADAPPSALRNGERRSAEGERTSEGRERSPRPGVASNRMGCDTGLR